MSEQAAIQFFSSPWSTLFYDFVKSVQSDLLIVSPFISRQPVEQIVKILESKPASNQVRVDLVTNLAVNNLLNGSLDVTALLFLAEALPNSIITYLPNLHAKVYVADDQIAIVTSANLTNGGLAGNQEYGVLFRDSSLVLNVRNDLVKYAMLGNQISLDTLTALAQATKDLASLRQQTSESVKPRLKLEFERRVDSTKLELLRARAKGKTTHGIFCDTILYLLERKGPLTTVDLHPLIQQIHPDLCDDSIDRVIDGVHFGKKWKHHVRTAQQALKRRGDIGFDGQRWFVIANQIRGWES